MIEIIKKAKEYAEEKHAGQKYGNEKPYMYHIESVAKNAEKILLSLNLLNDRPHYNTVMVCAFLHDIIEDTDTSIEEIEELFGKYVSVNVSLLTHDKEDSYVDYILKIRMIPIAVIVKIADLEFNISQSIKELKVKHNGYKKQRLEKYKLAKQILMDNINDVDFNNFHYEVI